jgi:hypothetical protein
MGKTAPTLHWDLLPPALGNEKYVTTETSEVFFSSTRDHNPEPRRLYTVTYSCIFHLNLNTDLAEIFISQQRYLSKLTTGVSFGFK